MYSRYTEEERRRRRAAYMKEYRRTWRRGHLRSRHNYVRSTVTEADVAARQAEIPDDTRDLTATLFGDPIPGDLRRVKP